MSYVDVAVVLVIYDVLYNSALFFLICNGFEDYYFFVNYRKQQLVVIVLFAAASVVVVSLVADV